MINTKKQYECLNNSHCTKFEETIVIQKNNSVLHRVVYYHQITKNWTKFIPVLF